MGLELRLERLPWARYLGLELGPQLGPQLGLEPRLGLARTLVVAVISNTKLCSVFEIMIHPVGQPISKGGMFA